MKQLTKEQSENLFNLVFENNMAAIFRTTIDGQFIAVNESYLRIFGFDNIEELKEYKSSDFYPNIETRESYITELQEKGSLKNYLIKNLDKFGNELFLLANVQLCATDPTILDGTFIDITSQIKSEKKLQETNNQLKKLSLFLEKISDAVYVVDREGRFIYMNLEAQRRFGITETTINNYTICDISAHYTTIEHFRMYLEEMKIKKNMVVETYHKNVLDGSFQATELSVSYEDFEGEDFLISTGRDITERIADRKSIEIRDKRITDLNNAINSSSMVSITNVDGVIIEVNEFFEHVSGYKKNELVGKTHNILGSDFHDLVFWQSFYDTITSGEKWVGDICNRKKSGEHYWIRSVIVPINKEDNTPSSYMAISQDITSEKLAHQRIQKNIDFQDLLMSIALNLLNVEPNEVSASLQHGLEEIGRFVDCDRVYIFDYNHEKESGSSTYEWCREGILPQIEFLQDVPFSLMPEWIETHFRGEIMNFPDIDSLPQSDLKDLLLEQGIKSLIALPLMDSGHCIGFIGFDNVREKKRYNDNDKKLLKLFAEMIVNINKRTRSMQLLESAHEMIKHQNKTLHEKVEQEVENSNKLNQLITSMDKKILIGEITSGIAHDMNTPLGAIKVGADSVRGILENLFKNVLGSVSVEQVHCACSRAVESNTALFVGSLQQMKETQLIKEFLNEKYPENNNRETLARAMVKARIQVEEVEMITKIMSSPNPEEYLNLIYHIQAVRTFIDTIIEAGEKAESVVKNLKFYIKEGAELKMEKINLKKNICEVIDVFNHIIRDLSVSVSIQIADSLVLTAVPEKMYQLWSNLLKNALDATGKNGWVEIAANESADHITISISNSGSTIPKDIQHKVWDKFFTTKDENGTGLGLSIVKRMADDHNAKLDLTSENEITTFYIQFPRSV